MGQDDNTKSIGSISELWDMVDKLTNKLKNDAYSDGHDPAFPQVWFRGHAQESYSLLPSLIRLTHIDIERRKKAERELHQEYSVFRPDLKDWQTLFHMQHFSVPTRLLDWTTDLSIALYFALNSEERLEPSIYLLHPSYLNYLAYRRSPKALAFLAENQTPFNPEKIKSLKYPDIYLVKDRDNNSHNIAHELPIAVMPLEDFDRVKVQNGKATVHGFDLRPIEEQCPNVIAKIILKVPSEEIGPFRKLGRQARDVFPDEVGMATTLKERYGLNPNPEKDIVSVLERTWGQDHQSLASGKSENVKTPGIAGCLVDDAFIERTEGELLAAWLKSGSSSITIVRSGAGGGKTNFLLNAVLKNALYLKRPVLFFSLNATISEDRKLTERLADFVRGLSNPNESIDNRILERMIQNGRILLILDGLDELARNKGGESIKDLSREINSLIGDQHNAPVGQKVVIACRDQIAEALQTSGILTALGKMEPIALKAIDPEHIRKRLDVVCQDSVLEIIGQIPLFYGILKDLKANDVPNGINNEAELWDLWIEMALGNVPIQNNQVDEREKQKLLHKLGVIATLMLKERADYIDEKVLKSADLVDLVKSLSDRGPGKCPVFIKEWDGNFRFIHQAFREYVLACSIHSGLENPGAYSVLTGAALDYESAETYIYLQKLLDSKHGRKYIVPRRLNNRAEKVPVKWNRYARNYFEAIGMLGVKTKKEREAAIQQCLNIIHSSTKATYRTKYNAARCLNRLHPTSLDPYCVWAITSWAEKTKRTDSWIVYGYAVRGFQRRQRKLDNSPAEYFISAPNPSYNAAHSNVSSILLDILKKLSEIPELQQEDKFYQANCSHALIRWLNRNDDLLVEDVKRLVKSPNLCREARGNLLLALRVHDVLPEGWEKYFIKGKTSKLLKVSLHKLCGPEIQW